MATSKKKKNTGITFTVINDLGLNQLPARIPSFNQVKTMAKQYGMEVSYRNDTQAIRNLGFNLNANTPKDADKAELIVPPTPILFTQDRNRPYFYHFNEWARMFDDVPPIPRTSGKVILHFLNDFKLDDGVIFLQVGGFTDSNQPSGFKVTIGTSIQFYQLKNLKNNYASQNIPITFSRPLDSIPRVPRKMPDIIIESIRLESWKLFSASYNPLLMVRNK